MMRLKKLRVASGQTQAQVAKMLNTTQQTYARWEAGKAEPPLSALRDLSLIFSTTVDHILGHGRSRPMTTRYYLTTDDADGFWGHLGLLLPGVAKTKWYPITHGEANRVRHIIGAGYDVSEWAIVNTLNNHILAFRPKEMQRIWLLDDACDEPREDWEWMATWNDYNGIPIEIYKAMSDWASDQICGSTAFEENNSAAMRDRALELIEEGKLLSEPEKLEAMLCDTVIYFVDGTTTTYQVDPLDLADTTMELDSDRDIVELSAEGGDFESYYPTAMLRMIDMSMIEVENGRRQRDEEFEREMT